MSIGDEQEAHLNFTESVIPYLLDDELYFAVMSSLSYDLLIILNKLIAGEYEVSGENTNKSK